MTWFTSVDIICPTLAARTDPLAFVVHVELGVDPEMHVRALEILSSGGNSCCSVLWPA